MTRQAAEAWLAVDPDPDTRAELETALDDPARLADLFGGRLEFGTAGLRGPLGPGPTRMNRVIVRSTAAALAETLAEDRADGPVVIGWDARHNSGVFALDTARVLAARDRAAVLLPGPVATPILAFATRRFGAVAGVQVTASHNPPADNGYKVYWGDGAQIVPPVDERISAWIDRVGLLTDGDLGPVEDPRISRVDDRIVDDYLDAVLAAAPAGSAADGDLRVVYTAMHGVGGSTFVDLWRRAGLADPVLVAEQFDPDPAFPTVAFPNPEEPGALDLAFAAADAAGADLVIANDPDADRLAVAVPGRDGRWRSLTGNEVGALLGDHLLAASSGPNRLVATSLVSSTLLDRLAAEHGARSERTLTGFKWIVRTAITEPGVKFVFGFEEALGYLVNDVVWDKDGLSAALVFARLAASLKASGRSVHDVLDDLAHRHGLHRTLSWSVRFEGADGAARMRSMIDALVSDPPTELAGTPVDDVVDLRPGGPLPPTDAVRIAAGSTWLVVRPSGTEPKLKLYAEVVLPVDGDVSEAQVAADAALGRLRNEAERRLGLEQ